MVYSGHKKTRRIRNKKKRKSIVDNNAYACTVQGYWNEMDAEFIWTEYLYQEKKKKSFTACWTVVVIFVEKKSFQFPMWESSFVPFVSTFLQLYYKTTRKRSIFNMYYILFIIIIPKCLFRAFNSQLVNISCFNVSQAFVSIFEWCANIRCDVSIHLKTSGSIRRIRYMHAIFPT